MLANQTATSTLDKFHEIEIQKIFDAMISFHKVRMQAVAFIGTVEIGAISIGLGEQKAGILVAAGVVIWIALLLDVTIVGILARFYYRALMLEAQFAPGDNDTFLTLLFMDDLGARVRRISSLPTKKERIRELKLLPVKPLTLPGFWIPFGIGVCEIAIGLMLFASNGWPAF